MLKALRVWFARPTVRFVASFVLVAGTLFSLYSFPYPDGSRYKDWSDAYLRGYSCLAAWVLSAFEPHVYRAGQDIVGRYSIRIIRGCDAVDAQILLFAAVVSSHLHSWRWRAAGALLGFLILTIANVGRICSLYYIGIFLPKYFDFFHHEAWPIALILLATGLFVLWSRLALERGRAALAVG
jgi:exosortase/archaeosortase family protein